MSTYPGGPGARVLTTPRARRATVALVAALTPWACGETVTLTTGDTLVAPILNANDATVVLDHPLFGEMIVPRERIQAIEPDDATPVVALPEAALPAVAAPDAVSNATQEPPTPPPPAPVAEPVNVPLPDAPPEYPWRSRAELGLTINEGSTQDARGYVALRTERQTDRNVVRLDTSFRYAEARSVRTENRIGGGVYGEWGRHLPRWNLFGQSRFDVDEFQVWDWRLTASGGLGYRFIESKATDDSGREYDRFLLSGRLGGGFRREFGLEIEETVPEGLAGVSFTYRLNGKQTINGESTIFPDLDSQGEFRTLSKLDWTIALTESNGINLKLGMLHEYETLVDVEDDRNDLTAYATLVFEF